MKDIFSKRLKNARLLAGLSQDELVEKMNRIISKNAISKYENGQMMADGKILIELSKILGVKTDYFFRPFTIDIKHVEFRKKHTMAIKEIKSIKQIVIDLLERYIEIEQFLNIESKFINPLDNRVISTIEDINESALKIRNHWKLGLSALPNVVELLEENEIKVIEIETSNEFDGFSGWADGEIPIIVLNINHNPERKRLTALHELGHLILNINSSLSEYEKEKICFQFAGAMLLPETSLKSEIGITRSHITIPELITVKETYGISIQAIMARAKDLGIINESRFVSFRKWINKNLLEEGLGSFHGIESSNRFKRLIYRAASEEIISLSKAANLSNLKLAEFRKDFISL